MCAPKQVVEEVDIAGMAIDGICSRAIDGDGD